MNIDFGAYAYPDVTVSPDDTDVTWKSGIMEVMNLGIYPY